MLSKVNIFWFRRDLRLEDNTGLFHALSSGLPVVPLFIFDSKILNELTEHSDQRVTFIHWALERLQEQLTRIHSSLDVRYGTPEEIFKELLEEYDIHTIFSNLDYEPYAKDRDASIKKLLAGKGVSFQSFKDQVIFEKDEVVKDDGLEYKVFTPYSKRWKQQLSEKDYKSFDTVRLYAGFLRRKPQQLPSLEEIGFHTHWQNKFLVKVDEDLIRTYHLTRDLPSVAGTTRLGVHLRFGTLSIRTLVSKALKLNEAFLNELIWREFFMQLLWRHPELVSQSYKKEYDGITWRNNEGEFERWCNGDTGYPIVDAGMRELNETGLMHNRARMITASFLVKHLLIDWRWGEAYFAKKLLDYELASNNGNWQWVAGCGCDAAPYFRVFNPLTQTRKFDPQLLYIKKWVPEYDSLAYSKPVVDHEFARERCLKVYKTALFNAKK